MDEWHLWERQDLISNKKVIHVLLSVCKALGVLFANKHYNETAAPICNDTRRSSCCCLKQECWRNYKVKVFTLGLSHANGLKEDIQWQDQVISFTQLHRLLSHIMESCQAKNVFCATFGRSCSVAAANSYVHDGTTMSNHCERHPTMHTVETKRTAWWLTTWIDWWMDRLWTGVWHHFY